MPAHSYILIIGISK